MTVLKCNFFKISRCNTGDILLLTFLLISIYCIILYSTSDIIDAEVNNILIPTFEYINTSNSNPDLQQQYKEKLVWALKPENRKITLLINSCGRLNLLNKTITSLMQYWPHSKYPLHEKILIDDSRNATVAQILLDRYFPEFEIVLTAYNRFEKSYINRDQRITLAMDKIFKQVTTPWIYHIEDDWMFTRSGFIKESFDIFETNVDEKYQTGNEWYNTECLRFRNKHESHRISLCPAPLSGLNNTYPYDYRHYDRYYHPEVIRDLEPMDHFWYNPNDKYSIVLCWTMYKQKNWINRTFLYEYKDSKWYEMQYFIKDNVMWGGFSFNSGLMPTHVYDMYIKRFYSAKGEWGMSQKLIDHGFKVALLASFACDHIGKGKHVEGTVKNNKFTHKANFILKGKEVPNVDSDLIDQVKSKVEVDEITD
eukprot:83873_1